MQLRNMMDGLWRRADAFVHPLERRQNGGRVLTIIQVVTSSAKQTFTGSAIMVTSTMGSTKAGQAVVGGAVLATRSTTSTDESAASSTADSSDDSAASSTALFAAATSNAAQSSSTARSSESTHTSQASHITSAPVVNASPSHVQASVASQSATSSAIPSPTSSPTPAAASGMSGGAKAGLAFGILFLIGALLAGVILLYRRQKQKKEAHERLDDEKAAMSQSRSPDSLPRNPEPVYPAAPAMAGASAPVARSQDTLAPRLDLRPVTQFDPRMSTVDNAAPGTGAALGASGAALAASSIPRTPSPSAWEKRGVQQHANDPTNPFGNHAETLNNTPPQTAQFPSIPELSSGHRSINAADFPLPLSGQVSPKPISLQYTGSTDSLPNPVVPYAPATVSNVSLPISEIAAAGVAGVVVTGAGAVIAGRGGNSPPLDNVHRVQLDFKPSMEDELEIRAGQLCRLLHEYDDGWALCTLMDRSQQGVVPRTCLSKQMVKPRPNPNNGSPSGPPPQGRPGQGPRAPGPNGSPQMRAHGPQMMPGNGRNSPAPYAQAPRPLTPNGRNSPAPYPGGRASPAPFAQAPRPHSPAGGPQGQRSRAMSNAPSYRAYQPGPGPQGPNGQQQRSQSPGPYGPPGMMRPPPIKDSHRLRSNSLSNMAPGSAPIVAGNAPIVSKAPYLARKPVSGQAV